MQQPSFQTQLDAGLAVLQSLASQAQQIERIAATVRDTLLADAPSSIKYDAAKPELAAEDKTIGNYKLNLKPENIRIVNADDVFAK